MVKLLTILIANILLSSLHAQKPEQTDFIHISVNEGLSQNTIFDIAQDQQGHMWFATDDGLNKYDGYDFTIYRHDEQNPHSISNDIIKACIVDTEGRIWQEQKKECHSTMLPKTNFIILHI